MFVDTLAILVIDYHRLVYYLNLPLKSTCKEKITRKVKISLRCISYVYQYDELIYTYVDKLL